MDKYLLLVILLSISLSINVIGFLLYLSKKWKWLEKIMYEDKEK